MKSYEAFAAELRSDAHVFARNLTSCNEEADRLVNHALTRAYASYREAGPGATPVWTKCVIYRNLMEALPR